MAAHATWEPRLTKALVAAIGLVAKTAKPANIAAIGIVPSASFDALELGYYKNWPGGDYDPLTETGVAISLAP